MKIKIVIGLFLLYNLNTNAQEINIKLNGGLSGILYDSPVGDGELKFGGGLGVGYTHFFSNHWGIATGVDFMYNQNSFKLNDGTTILSYEVDDQTSAFEYRVTPKRYKENQHFISFAIPVLLQYRTMMANQTQWYLGFGGKVLFPGKQTVEASASELQLSGYYPDLNLVIDDLPLHGFGKVTNLQKKNTVSLETVFLLSVETGLNFKLKSNLQLYTGVYADYGLTDLAKDTPNHNIVSYSPGGLNAVESKGVIGNKQIVEESRYFSAGIQLKLGFMLNKNKQESVKTTVAEPKTEAPVVTTKQPEPVPQKVTEVSAPAKVKEVTADERVYIEKPMAFEEVGNTVVSSQLASRLDEIAKILKESNTTEVNITGYTCNIGSESRNSEIGMLRAQAVADYLKNKSIETNRMHLFSKGESEPLVPNTSNANKALNRRVSINIVNTN